MVFGGPRRFGKQLHLRQLGTTIQTAFMERWYGTLRGLVAPLRRRTRCLSWSQARHRGRLWLMVSLYNFVMPHKSLRQGHTPRTPAMAIGLTDHVWSYREYIWVPVHTLTQCSPKQMEARITHLLTPALQAPPGDHTVAKSPPAKAKEDKSDDRSKGCLRCSLLFSRTTWSSHYRKYHKLTEASSQTCVYTLFRQMVLGQANKRFIRRESRSDKEFHFQNWVKHRLDETGMLHEQGGRNSYPDFRMVATTDGELRVEGSCLPGR